MNLMSIRGREVLAFILLSAIFAAGCKSSGEVGSNSSSGGSAKATPTVKPNSDGTIPSGEGVEREKPEAGKGNVQGKVFYNSKPVAGIEVKLCQTFSQYL